MWPDVPELWKLAASDRMLAVSQHLHCPAPQKGHAWGLPLKCPFLTRAAFWLQGRRVGPKKHEDEEYEVRPLCTTKPEFDCKRLCWAALFVHRLWHQGLLKEVTDANESRACTAEAKLTALSFGAHRSQGLLVKRPGVFSCLLATLQLAQT